MVFRLTSVLFAYNLLDLFPISMVHYSFNSFLSLSVFSESFGKNFARYCFVPRNEFSSSVLFGGFSFSITLFLHSVLFRYHRFHVPATLFVSWRIPIFFYLHVNRLSLVFLTRRTYSSHVFVCLRVLPLLCRLAKPVYNNLMFVLCFLEYCG